MGTFLRDVVIPLVETEPASDSGETRVVRVLGTGLLVAGQQDVVMTAAHVLAPVAAQTPRSGAHGQARARRGTCRLTRRPSGRRRRR